MSKNRVFFCKSKQYNIPAFTIASISSVVISPCHSEIFWFRFSSTSKAGSLCFRPNNKIHCDIWITIFRKSIAILCKRLIKSQLFPGSELELLGPTNNTSDVWYSSMEDTVCKQCLNIQHTRGRGVCHFPRALHNA